MDSAARLLCATLCAIVTYSPDQVFGQITPPPEGTVPVEANGLLYNLYYVPTHCKDPFVNVPKDVAGGLLVQNRERKVLMAKYNPYMIRGNIEIEPQGCLVIMPGVKMYFDPGFGIIVNGTLIARGSYIPNGRILMTKNPNAADHLGPNSPWPQDARLVDGNTTRDGRLDLQYNSKWRGVCTNYNNFTNIDLNVTCRHLGFVYGNFTYHSFSRNETDYMLLEKPACRGSENSLFDCPGAKDIKYGPTICDGQQVIGFECAGLRPDLAKDHWRGIEIYNSTVTTVYSTSERLRYNITETYLEYLDIEYAGLDIYKVDGLVHGFASISASPYVPIMNNITVSHGAYDGLNLTDIRGEIHIANSSVSHNRGHGLFIKSPVGQTLINMTDITHNWGDGVKMYVSNYTINEFNRDYPWSDSFCRVASSNQYMFPITLHQDVVSPIGEKPVGSSCQLNIRTAPQKMITLHTLIMERDPQASGMITVRDGGDLPSHPIILQFMVNNGSFPQSVTTKTDTIHIKFDFDIPRPDGEPVKRCKSHRPCIRFLMELTTNYGPDIELRVYNASVSNNTGYGVNIQDVRSKVSINSSVVSDNCYGAGIRVYQGAAEIAINSTIIERNMKSGVNISYSGGYQLINGSIIANNYGYGVITEYLLLNRTRFELDGKQKIEVVKSFFMWNEWTAFRIGNYCRGGEYLVNQSYFAYNLHESIEYLSCNISTSTPTNFSMAFTEFRGNKRHAVLISPIVNTVGTFTNNTFREHTLGVLRIDNGYNFIENRWYRELPVAYKIYENKFTNNTGRYVVNFRLSQPGVKHRLEFKFNTVQGNIIVDPFQYLKPRSKADAVIVVSSGNVEIQRNLIDNPKSIRDIATHLVDPSVLILANYNWWMTFEHSLIYPRLFDRNSRYNLAELKYHPVLKNNWLYGNYDTSLEPEYRWPFARGNYIGGVLDDNFVTNDYTKTYRVDRDIIILKGKTLEILAGTTLEFLPSIGMMILGRLKADGANVKFGPPQEIKFKLYEDDYIPIENRTVYEEIRLVDGANDYEGRLELNLTGEFGTVCSDGWTDQNSALVCQQLGLTFNPLYGRPTQVMFSDPTRPIYLSYVSCDTLDTDVRKCRSMKRGEFSCDHSRDVFIRCQPPTWSGVTIPAQPRHGRTFETQLRYVSIEKAGLLDFIEMSYAPGLRIDYNFYKMSYIYVRNCVSDGINIKYANPFSQSLLEKVTVENNLGNGIVTRSPFLEMSHISLVNNAKAGFVYDPMFTEYEALSVRNFISKDETISLTTQTQLQVGPDKMIFLTTDPNPIAEDRTYEVEIITGDPFFRVCIQVFDYNPLTSIEKVTFYSSNRYSWQSAKSWTIEEDLVDFPIVSSQQFMTIRYRVNGTRSGRLAFAVISVGYNQNYDSIIKVYNATIKNNERGIVTKHYNNPSNERMEIFHRAKKETIHFELMTIEGSKQEAMFIPSLTKWHTNFIPTLEEMTRAEKVGEIKYVIVHSKIKNNYKGIHAEHNHVDFANNVWKWNVSYVTIENCETGGFEIELPRVNDLIERQVHQVIVNSSEMMNNKKFSFNILGYYADVRIEANKIHDNNCLLGVMKMSGMEKDLYIYENRIENNINCKFAIDLDLMSHSEYSSSVSGMIMYNYITSTRNTYVPQGLGITSTPVTYAVQVKGVQNVTLVRNVFDNKDLQYELVAGVTALILDNKMNVKENYWGTTDQYQIRKRIFDFDDWNNYAIAEYFPFLGVPNPRGDLAPDSELVIRLDLNRLGGRVIEDLTLPYRSEPYIVYSDLTIMPDAKFSIPAGVHLKFYPNVGILVLGQLVATGAPYSRIKFSPAEPELPFGRRKRQEPQHPETLTSSDIRFVGGKHNFEGFLELYNASSRSWNIMCDGQFNEKTAEVVCRSLGMETVNVDVRFTPLYDFFVYGKPMYFLKEFWAYSYYCRGSEDSLDFCLKRINYNIKPCIFAGNFTFIRCGLRNLPKPLDYWGNIRFANPKYDEEINPYHDDFTRSRLQYVDIVGAGMLHGEKVGAIQTTYVNPIMDHMNITKCVLNGIDVVAPRQGIKIEQHNISNNLGYGINFLVLNGDSMASDTSSFIPLITNTVPYNLYGLVDICRMEKEIVVENRLLLFYKYSQSSMDCVKIIRGYSSSVGAKPVALRFLQFSLYYDEFYRNIVEIFNGRGITLTNQLAQLSSKSQMEEVKRQYKSTNEFLTIHIHASPSYGFYGFVAEVVTLPMSGLTYPDDSIRHEVRDVIMMRNQDGALMYKNVGDITPSIYIEQCWIENNGVGILNLTSPPVIDVGLQSTRIFVLKDSFIARNKGGTYITATTPSAATKLRANITNNVFAYGTHGEVLNLTGHHYEKFLLYENYIYNNSAGDYRDVIHVQNVVVNFTFNTVTNNTGHYIVRLYNTENTEATQEYTKSLFTGNNATAVYRALFHVGSGNPKINKNYLVNEECDFELETNPVNKLPNGEPGNSAPIDAGENWWGLYSTGYVNGKIWDKLDNASLVAVNYMPMKVNNESLIYGKCAPGWFLEDERCYKYFGAALPYDEANQFCVENGGFLAEAKGKQEFIRKYIRLIMNVYSENQRVWVYSEVTSGRCSAFEKNYVVEEYDCFYVMHPFVCEKDPYISPPGSTIHMAVIGIAAGVGGFLVIVVIILLILWRVKSRKRSEERFERQESIRASVKGSTIRTRSQMSLSSSKYLYDQRSLGASQVSIEGITDDETTTDTKEVRRRLRQQAEIARGRQEDEDYPRYAGRNHSNGVVKNGPPHRSRGRSEESDDEDEDYGFDKRREAERDRVPPAARHGQQQTNGGYKYSDESHEHTDRESDEDDMKKEVDDTDEEEEEARRNSFTPVKFKPSMEKELDSIQMKSNGSIQYLKQDDTGSVDLSGTARNLSRSMSSFSGQDVQAGQMSSRSDSQNSDVNLPPPPLPLNIPASQSKPRKQPLPVPAPRLTGKPLPSARSYGSKENISSPRELKMNNLSQDEVSDYRGSRDKLDSVDSYPAYPARKAPSRENLSNVPLQVGRSRERLDELTSRNVPSPLGAGIEFLPCLSGPRFEEERQSPMLHDSRENLLPKRQDSDSYKPPPTPAYEPLYPGNNYNPSNRYGTSPDNRYPVPSANPGIDYLDHRTPLNTDYSPLSSGMDYLPSDTRTPMKSRHLIGQHPSVSTNNSDYESYDGGYKPPIGAGPRLVDTTPGYYDYNPPQARNIPLSTGVNLMPKNDFAQSPRQQQNNVSRSRENLSRSREYLTRSRDNMSTDFASLSVASYDSEIQENSTDFEKPRQQKSVETEI